VFGRGQFRDDAARVNRTDIVAGVEQGADWIFRQPPLLRFQQRLILHESRDRKLMHALCQHRILDPEVMRD
jgi:hypothetical protein